MENNFRVIILDDDRGMLDTLPEMIEFLFPSCQIDTAENTSDFFKILRNEHDILISDLQINDKTFNGLDIIGIAKNLHPNIKAVLMSGSLLGALNDGSEKSAKEAAEEKGIICWGKPFSMEMVEKTIAQLLSGTRGGEDGNGN